MACLHALVVPSDKGLPVVPLDDEFWKSVSNLADDTIVGVRIGVARLLGFVSGTLKRNFWVMLSQHNNQHLPGRLHSSPRPLSSIFWDLVHRLSCDDSQEVRLYIPDPSQLSEFNVGLTVNTKTKERFSNLLTFSRPPLGPS